MKMSNMEAKLVSLNQPIAFFALSLAWNFFRLVWSSPLFSCIMSYYRFAEAYRQYTFIKMATYIVHSLVNRDH